MTTIDKTKPVMVTGATGYIAGWIVKKLLEEGATVHAAVRNLENKDKVAHLDKIAAATNGTIKYFKTDLLNKGSFLEAMQDCELVIHTASPFFMKVKDPQKDLIDPALKGTRNILESVNETPSVKRVVLTSSLNAIYGDNIDAQNIPNNTFTEEYWNTSSSLSSNPYAFSKTVAEKEAWKICESQNQWDLVVINPSFVMGPATNPHANFESRNVLIQMGDGTFKAGVPAIDIGLVDVRNIAEAHIKAGFTPEAKGRYIVSAENSSFIKMSDTLRTKFRDKYPLPKKVLPKWLIWLIAPMAGLKRKFVSRNVGYPMKIDNSKGIKELEIEYIATEKTLGEFFQQLIDEKLV